MLQQYAKTNWFWPEKYATDHKSEGALASGFVVVVPTEILLWLNDKGEAWCGSVRLVCTTRCNHEFSTPVFGRHLFHDSLLG